MQYALTLARRGLGRAMPNPSVGAVIVRGMGNHRGGQAAVSGSEDLGSLDMGSMEISSADQAEIVGTGHTAPGGRPHAETQALAAAGPAAKGATIYVTLEPCSHTGKTPPCARAIIDAGIARVVVGTGDPDARVAGRGIAMLRAAGIAVVEGVCEREARWIALGHIRRVQARRPFVQMKLAVSANDLVSHAQAGKPVWVTGAAARKRVHLMRAQTDAVLTGIGTVLADNPELTCRLPSMTSASPIRIVLDRTLRLPLNSKLVNSARDVPLWVLCSSDAEGNKAAALEHLGAEILRIGTGADAARAAEGLDWTCIMSTLADRGLTRLMVEAGPRIARSLGARSELVDEYVLFRGDKPLDSTMGTPLRQIWPHDWLERMQQCETTLPGGDRMISYR